MKSKTTRSNYQGKRWCFTTNLKEASQDEIAATLNIYIEHGKNYLEPTSPIKFIVFQLEKGETGTQHIQGYFELRNKKGIRGIKLIKGFETCHLQKANGTAQDNITYCSKPEGRIKGPYRFGSQMRQGVSQSLISLNDMISRKEVTSMEEIRKTFPHEYYHHGRMLQKALNDNQIQRNWKMETYIFVGTTGVGKSCYAWKKWPEAYNVVYPTSKGNKWWWNFYEGQETIIMDEWREQMKFDDMLKLLDRYPLTVEGKGTVLKFRSKRIVITTNLDPRTWYSDEPDRTPLLRRLDDAKIYDFLAPEKFHPDGRPVVRLVRRKEKLLPKEDRALLNKGYKNHY